jgi:hypothetical protein
VLIEAAPRPIVLAAKYKAMEADDRGEGKAATDQRLTCKWTLYMKQMEQSESDSRLHGDAAERCENYCFRQMEGVRGKSQSNGEHGNTGCGRANHFEATFDWFWDPKAYQHNHNA